jgi:hypothetical protein
VGQLTYLCNGHVIGHADDVGTLDSATLACVLRVLTPGLKGGKGGFGSNLKMSGKSGASGRTVNFNACRDLNGRRLKNVNDEMRLRAWLAEAEGEKRKRMGAEYTEPKGPSGVVGWHLTVPTWAEGVKGMGGKGGQYRTPRKTRLCQFWLEARQGGNGTCTRPADAGAVGTVSPNDEHCSVCVCVVC